MHDAVPPLEKPAAEPTYAQADQLERPQFETSSRCTKHRSVASAGDGLDVVRHIVSSQDACILGF
jgi:hypothetical protein